MARVSLRVYNREIEVMIEGGKLEEAVAHCQHILKDYPMHVETYRLLGKSFLEARRYTDAADIFQRVLMAVPDDFVAHVGMSIIRDDEGKLDDAIWHMERAFEGQPSNPAIQGELRRLYGRRDGVEPPKIRLSRDALANMYAQGELFNQAIAEIRAVLAEDANRPDLQVMLARAYYRSGQKVEAAEMAANLLKKYTYCMDALRILVDILPGSARAENTQVYRQRLRLMDPYSSFATGSVFNTDQVADTTVTMERLEYTAGAATSGVQPNWASSLGIRLTDEKRSEPAPDWLKAADSKDASIPSDQAPSREAAPAVNDKSVPDWMRTSGWQESSGDGQEQPVDSSLDQPADQIARADIPDWLKAMAPQEINETKTDQNITPEVQPVVNAGNIPDWLTGMGTGKEVESTGPKLAVEHLPSQGESDVPDWLAAPEAASTEENPVSGSVPEMSPLEKGADLPDWLAGLDAGTADTGASSEPGKVNDSLSSQAETPDWLAGSMAANSKTDAGSESASIDLPAPDEGEIPDWLSEKGTVIEKTNIDSPQPAAISPEEDFPDWLKGLGQNVSENKGMEFAENAMEQTSAEIPPVSIEPVSPVVVDQGQAVSMDSKPQMDEDVPFQPSGESKALNIEDDTMAWLEGLAAKQGAKEEELLTKPEDRLGEVPDWLRQPGKQPIPATTPEPGPVSTELAPAENIPSDALGVDSQQPAPSEEIPTFEKPVEGTVSPLNIEDDTMAWLEGLAAKQGAKEEELLTKPEDRLKEIPDWLRQPGEQPIQATTPEPSPAPVEPSPEDSIPLEGMGVDSREPMTSGEIPTVEPLSEITTTPLREGDNLAWLQDLAAEQGAKEELLSKPEDRLEEIPEWLRTVSEQPSPLSSSEPSSAPPEETLPLDDAAPHVGEVVIESQLSTNVIPTGLESKNEDIPDWLRSIEEKSTEATAPEYSSALNETPTMESSKISGGEIPTLEPRSDEAIPTPEIPAGETGLPPADDSLAWLDDLEFEHDAKPEETLTDAVDESKISSDLIPEGSREPVAPAETPSSESQEEDISITSWLSKLDVEEALGKRQSVPEAAQPSSPQASDLPDWLKELEKPAESPKISQPAEELPEWLPQVTPSAQDEAPVIPPSTPNPEPELPSWIDEETPVSEKTEATAPGEWVPVDEKVVLPPVIEPEPENAPVSIEPLVVKPNIEPVPTIADTTIQPRVPKGTGMLAHIPAKEKDAEFLAAAQSALDANKLTEAMQGYAILIKKNRLLDEVIHDLREAIYRFPVDIIVWQTLGDACMRANRLQDALDAYTKAEELLR